MRAREQRRFCTSVLAAVLLPLVTFSGISVDPWDTTVTPGAWCGNFHAASNYVARNDSPMVFIWATDGCGYCENLSNALAMYGSSWVSSVSSHGKKVVFCFVEGKTVDGKKHQEVAPNTGGVKAFAKGTLTDFPFVCVHWPNRLTERFSGQHLPSSSEYPLSAAALQSLCGEFEAKVESILSSVVFDRAHVAFPMGDNPCDRLEAVAGRTQGVDVPVVRTNETASAVSCSLLAEWPNRSETIPLSWQAGEARKVVSISVAGLASGMQVTLSLRGSNGETLAVRHIWVIDEPENSPKNPYWLGEKQADELNWGEWSMEIDVVTNKVRAFNAAHSGERASAMMFVGGSTWCPDCAMAEKNFFSKQAFKDWAVANKVVFGVLDIPNNPQATEASPSQLRYESARASDAFVTLRGTAAADESERYQSGAGYLSRHSVPYEAALAIAERNAFLMGHDTLHGGWNRPERTNKNRTGVPVLILLRDDGTVAARWNRFSDVGPAAYADGYLRRFEEMLAQVDDMEEERDDDRSTTARTIASGESASSSVSAVDQADVYLIADAVQDKVMVFRLTGGAAELKMSVIDGVNGAEVASTNALASDCPELTVKFGGSGPYYLRVAPAVIQDGTHFGYTNEGSTVCYYTVEAAGWMSGGEFGFAVAATNVAKDCGSANVTVCRRAGSSGAASVTVRLTEKSGVAVDRRISWRDQTLHWADGDSSPKSAQLQVFPDSESRFDLHLGFELSDAHGDAGDVCITPGKMRMNVYDGEYYGTPVYRFVEFESVQEVPGYVPGDEVRLSAADGDILNDVSLAVVDGRVRVSGAPRSAAGDYLMTVVATLTRNGGAAGRQVLEFPWTVIDYDFSADIPSLAESCTYGNLPLVEDGALTGLLTLTVPPDGSLSAKYLRDGQAFSYSCEGWTSFDRDHGRLTAQLIGTLDSTQILTVTLDRATGTAVLLDPVCGTLRTFDLFANVKNAAPWRGQYAVQMPQTNVVDGVERLNGAAYLALRMVSDESVQAGSMLYAGVLPNGRAVYGSACLRTNAVGHALVPFYHVADGTAAPYAFSGGLALRPNAEQEYRAYRWSVTAAWTPVWTVPDGLGRASEFNVFGGYYDSSEITARFKEDFAGDTDNFAIQADTWNLTSGRYGVSSIAVAVIAEMTETNCPALTVGAANPQQVKLAFSPLTGVISGSFVIPFAKRDVPVSFRGIALPGWQGCDVCSEGFVARPWAVGSCSFSDRTGGAGTFRNGCEIRMDRYR